MCFVDGGAGVVPLCECKFNSIFLQNLVQLGFSIMPKSLGADDV